MSFTLYPHQSKFVSEIRKSLAKHKRIIACSATGSGKTKMMITIARSAIERGKTVLVLSEATKIYRQIHQEIGDTVNIGDGVKEFCLHPGKIYVAMCQTLAKRPLLIQQLAALGSDLIIENDEAHVGTSTNVLRQLPDAYLIGFTATPDFRVAKYLPDLYKECVVGPQPQELVETEYLTPYYHYQRQVVNMKALKKSSTGDFTEASQESAFQKKQVFDSLIEDLLLFKFRKCMIFCASIKHCSQVVAQLREIGYDVSECHSKNNKSDWELFQFTNGANTICVSVASLTKGFDFAEIDLIFLNRATLSLALYLQMIGRGSRITYGKTRFTVVDNGGNGTRHKPWNFEHPWGEMWKGKPKTKEGAAPMKFCPVCGFMIAASIMVCSECKHVYLKTPEDFQKETELIELTQQFNNLRGRKISTLTPAELHLYVQLTNKKEFAKRIASAQGESFLQDYAKHSKWTYGWWNHTIADPTKEFTDITIR